jgi:hypothetical protein
MFWISDPFLWAVAVTPVSLLPIAIPSVDPVSYFQRTWPPTLLVAALIINAAWMGLLGYGLFELGEMVF